MSLWLVRHLEVVEDGYVLPVSMTVYRCGQEAKVVVKFQGEEPLVLMQNFSEAACMDIVPDLLWRELEKRGITKPADWPKPDHLRSLREMR